MFCCYSQRWWWCKEKNPNLVNELIGWGNGSCWKKCDFFANDSSKLIRNLKPMYPIHMVMLVNMSTWSLTTSPKKYSFKNPRVAHLKLEHFKPFFQRQFKKINWYDAFMDFTQHGTFKILGMVKKMGGITLHLLNEPFLF